MAMAIIRPRIGPSTDDVAMIGVGLGMSVEEAEAIIGATTVQARRRRPVYRVLRMSHAAVLAAQAMAEAEVTVRI